MTDGGTIFDLHGKKAVVTGTSAGIGSRLARTLVVAGARVVAIARRPTELGFVPGTDQGELISMQADLAEHNQVTEAAKRCLSVFEGSVDILVNNTAYLAPESKPRTTRVKTSAGHLPSTWRHL